MLSGADPVEDGAAAPAPDPEAQLKDPMTSSADLEGMKKKAARFKTK